MIDEREYVRQIKVAAIGGGACRALDRMLDQWSGPPCTVAVDTDDLALDASHAAARLPLGARLTKGYGSGGDPRIGKLAAEESVAEWRSLCIDTDWMILLAAMGGGTATGAAATLARVAVSSGTKVMAVAMMPFDFEDAERAKRAQRGLTDLHAACDAVVTVPNSALLRAAGIDAPAHTAFATADGATGMMLAALCRMVLGQGLLTLDLPSLRNLLQGRLATAAYGFGSATGTGRAAAAMADLLACPLFPDGQRPQEAAGVWAAVLTGTTASFQEIESALVELRSVIRSDAAFFPGVYVDERYGDRFELTAITVGAVRKRGGEDLMQLDVSTPLSQAAVRRHLPPEEQLKLESPQKGRFKDVDPTLVDGQDLDVPTYIRHRIHFEQAR